MATVKSLHNYYERFLKVTAESRSFNPINTHLFSPDLERYKATKKAQRKAFKLSSTTLIQKIYRGYISRQNFKSIVDQVLQGAITKKVTRLQNMFKTCYIQAAFRFQLILQVLLEKRAKAANIIKHYYAGKPND